MPHSRRLALTLGSIAMPTSSFTQTASLSLCFSLSCPKMGGLEGQAAIAGLDPVDLAAPNAGFLNTATHTAYYGMVPLHCNSAAAASPPSQSVSSPLLRNPALTLLWRDSCG